MNQPQTQTKELRSVRFTVLLTDTEKAALDRLVQRARSQFPAFVPTPSEVVRKLVIDADLACPQCGGETRADPDRPGCRFCEKCQEPVVFASEPA